MNLYELKVEHNRGLRPISVAPIRETFPDIHWRTWQRWRSIADCPPRAQKISRLSAIKLWALGMSGGTVEEKLSQAVIYALKTHGERLEEWLRVTSWQVSGVELVMRSINSIDDRIDVIYRQRLYEWSEKAGLTFSTRRDYSHAQVARIAGAARRGIGKGRPRAG